MRIAILSAAALAASAVSAPATAKQGDFQVRVRAITVQPQEDVGPVLPTFPTGSATITNSYVPEVDFTYFVTDHIGVELIAATARHGLNGTGALAGVGRLANTWVLPPTLTLQYHFAPEGKIRPYIGAGINWTMFYADKASDALVDAIGATEVDLSNSWGWAAQAGVDIPLNDKMFVNLDIKYVDMDTTARLTTGALVNTVRASIDPLIIGVGLGWRF